jgi:Holliday junction resolvasome RuvABC DNA-binding subunit
VCKADRVEAHVRTLVSAAHFSDSASLKARADAVTALLSLGFESDRVVEARAQAKDGWSVAQILDQLNDSPLPAEVC